MYVILDPAEGNHNRCDRSLSSPDVEGAVINDAVLGAPFDDSGTTYKTPHLYVVSPSLPQLVIYN